MSEVPRLLPEPTRSGYTPSFDGTRIYWELHEAPEGAEDLPPLVFCYGLVCSVNQWRAQVERFRTERTCLLLDYRGHHRSGTPKDRRLMNISACARDVAAAVREVDLAPAHVWGHSLGCNVGLEYALAFPEQVRSLVLLNGTTESPFKGMFGTDLLEKVVDPLFKAYAGHEDVYHAVWSVLMSKPEAVAFVAKLGGGFNADASTAEDIETYARAVVNVSPETFFPLIIELAKGSTAGILPKIKTPAFVIAGGKDRVTPPREQKLMVAALSGAQYLEVPTGSHNVQLDFGDYVNMKAEEFWGRLDLDSPSKPV